MNFQAHERAALELLAEAAIMHQHNIAVTQDANKEATVGEPMFVARLCEALTGMASGWRSQLMTIDPNARLSITSIFTHQKPYVRFPSGGANIDRCELADLAVVLIDRSNPAKVASRCLFLQAKRADTQQVTLKAKGDLRQLKLYTKRPTFDVARLNAPAGIEFPPSDPDNFLNYGLTPPATATSGPVDAAWANTRWMLAQKLCGRTTTNQLKGTRTLQAALVDLLEGSAGCAFDLAADDQVWNDFSGSDNWSALINFILEDTASALRPSYARRLHKTRGYGEQVLYVRYADRPQNIATVCSSYGEAPDRFAAKISEQMLWARHNGVGREPPHRQRKQDYEEEYGGMSVAVIEISLPRRD